MVTDMRKESNAVVLCIMDTSGSMDTMKKYLARSFFFLLYQFIRTKYRNVEIVFIAHHTEANEVTEEEFFHKGESGGTFISSGYQKALEIIQARYHPSLWNVYAFHCSDGDNFDSDNPAALRARARSWPTSATCSATARSSRSARATTRARCSTSSAASTPTTSRPCSSSARKTSGRASRPSSPRTAAPTRSDGLSHGDAPYDLQDLEALGRAHPREGRRSSASTATRRSSRSATTTRCSAYMAYSGMPSHYPHWSYGKAYEKLKTLYDYGVSGLPVRDGHQLEPGARVPDARQLAAAADPDHRARLRAQRLLQEQLHLPEHARRVHASAPSRRTRNRVRTLRRGPEHRLEKVETILDAAHALSLQCRRNLAVRKLTPDEERQRLLDAARAAAPIRSSASTAAQEYVEPDLRKVPLAPDEDLLLFIRDHNPYLAEWEKDLLTIVHEEAQYFIPQIETKIMNEGWAIVLAQAHPRQPRAAAGAAPRVHRPPQPGGAPVPRRPQPVPPRPARVGGHRAAATTTPTPEEARALGRTAPDGHDRSSSRSARPIATSRSCAAISPRR